MDKEDLDCIRAAQKVLSDTFNKFNVGHGLGLNDGNACLSLVFFRRVEKDRFDRYISKLPEDSPVRVALANVPLDIKVLSGPARLERK